MVLGFVAEIILLFGGGLVVSIDCICERKSAARFQFIAVLLSMFFIYRDGIYGDYAFGRCIVIF